MNGVVVEMNDKGFAIRVQQSFGNCPKYIQAREPIRIQHKLSGVATRSRVLDARAMNLIRKADTFFIASAHPASAVSNRAHGVDVSHRGGKPGFVRIAENTLTVPDFVGNFFFNTVGNLTLEPRAGLLFVDFDNGDLLYLAVRVEIIWDDPELGKLCRCRAFVTHAGAGRNICPSSIIVALGTRTNLAFFSAHRHLMERAA